MYQVTIKGRNLDELKKAVADIHNELSGGSIITNTAASIDVSKNLEQVSLKDELKKIKPVEKEVVTVAEAARESHPVQMKEIDEKMNQPDNTSIISANISQSGITVTGELDAEGLPWDKRIHSSGKTRYKKTNCWIKKKKTDAEFIRTVENELREALKFAANPPVVPPMPGGPIVEPQLEQPCPVVESLTQPVLIEPTAIAVPPVVNAPPVAPVVVVPAPIVEAPVVAQPVAVVTPPQPVMSSANGHTLDTFKANFPMILASLITEGKITQDYVNTLKTYFNVDEIWNVSDDQKADMFESFSKINLIQRVQ